jgi:hypothetical protein
MIQSHARTDGRTQSGQRRLRSSARRANRCRGARQLSREPRARAREKRSERARATQCVAVHSPSLSALRRSIRWGRGRCRRAGPCVRCRDAVWLASDVADAITVLSRRRRARCHTVAASPCFITVTRWRGDLCVWCEHGRTSGSPRARASRACDRTRKESNRRAQQWENIWGTKRYASDSSRSFRSRLIFLKKTSTTFD